MSHKSMFRIALAGAALFAASPGLAAPILIINGSSNTSESGTTSSITTRLTSLHTAAGNLVTVADDVPTDISSYGQVWDLRFSNSSALTAPVITEYVNYLAGGGGMFVMGENASFGTRNASVISLILAAGGGALNFVVPGDSQQVYAPFNQPVPVSTVNYLAAGGVNGFGTGQWITSNALGTAGTGVAFTVGSLANAHLGALTAIFDVNFLQTGASENNQALAANLVGFVGAQVGPPIIAGAAPEPSTWVLMILGFGMTGASIRRRQKQGRKQARLGALRLSPARENELVAA